MIGDAVGKIDAIGMKDGFAFEIKPSCGITESDYELENGKMMYLTYMTFAKDEKRLPGGACAKGPLLESSRARDGLPWPRPAAEAPPELISFSEKLGFGRRLPAIPLARGLGLGLWGGG